MAAPIHTRIFGGHWPEGEVKVENIQQKAYIILVDMLGTWFKFIGFHLFPHSYTMPSFSIMPYPVNMGYIGNLIFRAHLGPENCSRGQGFGNSLSELYLYDT